MPESTPWETRSAGADGISMRRLAEVALLLLPLAYGAYLFTTLVHEAVGHGFVAWFVGGRFDGFTLRLDGMGWAEAYVLNDRTIWRSAMIYAGGIITGFVSGYILLRLAGARVTSKPVRATAMAVIGLSFLLDALPYMFWSSLYETGYGDPVSFIELTALQQGTEQHTLRWMMIVIGCLGTLIAHIAGFSLLTRSITAMIAPYRALTHRQHVLLVLSLLVLPVSVLWLLFDWDQLVPTSGYWPPVYGIACTLFAGSWACRQVSTDHIRLVHDEDTHSPDGTPTQPDPETVDHPPRLVVPIVLAWAFLLVQVIAIVLWLSDGVKWA